MRKFEFGTENEIIKQERDQKKGELKHLQVIWQDDRKFIIHDVVKGNQENHGIPALNLII